MDRHQLFAVVLAAGAATRFQTSKQLALYAGLPLVQRAVRLSEAVCPKRTVLVTGSDWQRVHDAAAPLSGFLVRNEMYGAGMGGSIACGVRSVAAAADAVMILLADQPLISTDYLRQMIVSWKASEQQIIASEYAGIAGPPAIFPARYFEQLAHLEGDSGARALLREHQQQVITIPCDAAACDIDTMDDLSELQNRSC